MNDRDELAELIHTVLHVRPVCERIADAILAAGWRAPVTASIKLNSAPDTDAGAIYCRECHSAPGEPCFDIQKENLDGRRWTSFPIRYPAGSYHGVRENDANREAATKRRP